MRTKASRAILPDSFIELSETLVAKKEEFDEYKMVYIEEAARLVDAGFPIAQLAEISPFSYAQLNSWVKAVV